LKKGQFADELHELLANAPYGGELRIYFNAIFSRLLTGDTGNDFKRIRFYGDVIVAIADSRMVQDTMSGCQRTSPSRFAGTTSLRTPKCIIPMPMKSAGC